MTTSIIRRATNALQTEVTITIKIAINVLRIGNTFTTIPATSANNVSTNTTTHAILALKVYSSFGTANATSALNLSSSMRKHAINASISNFPTTALAYQLVRQIFPTQGMRHATDARCRTRTL